ncbi:MAG TPA: DUF6544 family protein [Gemmatimonadaceae bacterium]|nr:DUF6544 family protein [Gemmatimonadaceae bacterium]
MLETLAIVALVLIVVALAVLAYGTARWDRETRDLRARLDAAREPVQPRTVDFRELAALPEVVQRYFRSVLVDGQPMIGGARVSHRGAFRMGESTERWRPFTSDQRVVTRRPGFDWNARISMLPGLTVRVHDAYIAGEGILHAAIAGAFTVADLRGTREIAEGELMRFIAEAAWYPTALLPSQGAQWEAVDAQSARVTVADGPLSLTMTVQFDDEGLIRSVGAATRGRTVGDRVIPTPWEGRFWTYERRGGMLVPLDGEVAWLLPEGEQPYWRGRITELQYEFAE